MMRDVTGQDDGKEHLQESSQHLERRIEELAAMNAIYQAQLSQRENGTERR